MILHSQEPTSLLIMLSRCWNLFFLTVFSSIMIASTNKYIVVLWEARLVLSSPTLSSMRVPPKTWKRYVDDSVVIIKKDCVPEFHDKLNSIDPMISFTMEKESNQQISFLDTLVSRKNGFIVIDVFRKPTHKDRYLDFNSHHEKKHKISTASTLLNRACNLPNTLEGKSSEVNYVTNTLLANGYPPAVISNVLKEKNLPRKLFLHRKNWWACFSI